MKKRTTTRFWASPRGVRGRHQEGLPAARPQAPPRRQSGRQVRAEEVPGGPGGLRRPSRTRRSGGRTTGSGHAGRSARASTRASGAGGFPGARRRFDGSALRRVPVRGGDLGDLFGNTLRRRERATGPEKGEDAQGTIEIPFREAVLGGQTSLSLRREKECAQLPTARDASAAKSARRAGARARGRSRNGAHQDPRRDRGRRHDPRAGQGQRRALRGGHGRRLST